MSSLRLSTLLPLLLLGLVGCSASPPSSPPATGAVRLTLSLPTQDISGIAVTVTAPDMSPLRMDLKATAGVWGGVLEGIPAGFSRTLRAQAVDLRGAVRYEGETDTDVTPGTTSQVTLFLQDPSASEPFTNQAPIIDSLSADRTTVLVEDSVSLTANVHDPDSGDELSYTWSAPSGRFSYTFLANTVWTAPTTPGPVTLTLTVNDSHGAYLTVDLTVQVSRSGWTVTGAPITPRSAGHTATLLPNGKVLVTGGYLPHGYPPSFPALATAELYDPDTGTWSPTGTMREARGGHTATLLPNGKVLVVGGNNYDHNHDYYLSSAEVYDPATGTWSPASPLHSKRSGHAATLLSNGKVLVSGGRWNATWSDFLVAQSELYDPDTDTWSSTGGMASPRYGHQALLLPDGKVLAAGGQTNYTYYTGPVEVYDPASGLWSRVGIHEGASGHVATLLTDGQVLLSGGYIWYEGSGADLYDPDTSAWKISGPMHYQRGLHVGTRLADGRVLVLGGGDYNTQGLKTTELYDPALGLWSLAGSLSKERGSPTATLLPNGKVLVVGGGATGADGTDPAELYTP